MTKIENSLGEAHKKNLLNVFTKNENNISLLSQLKRIEQSTRAQSMKYNAELLEELSILFFDNKQLIRDLNLSDQATAYFSKWTLKAKTGQVKQFRRTSKIYLYLLGFVKQQYYKRQDAALEGFLKCVRESLNEATKKAEEYEKNNLFKKKQGDRLCPYFRTKVN